MSSLLCHHYVCACVLYLVSDVHEFMSVQCILWSILRNPAYLIEYAITTQNFNFLWECLRIIYMGYWGRPNQPGSLCSPWEAVRQVQVDKGVKVFSNGDGFLLHCFQSHLLANICKQLGVENPSNTILMRRTTSEWLEQTATIIQNTFFWADSRDGQYSFHWSFLRATYNYIDLRSAIKHENGDHILRLWKFGLLYFHGNGCKNYCLGNM